jgi:hypothetical protein
LNNSINSSKGFSCKNSSNRSSKQQLKPLPKELSIGGTALGMARKPNKQSLSLGCGDSLVEFEAVEKQ